MNSTGKSESRLHVDAPDTQRRLTVFFRGILILPQWFVIVFLLYATLLLTVPGWFIAVFTGRNPFHRLMSAMMTWYYRVSAYGLLLTDTYPPFRLVAPLYPIDIDFEEGTLGRLSVLFRLILVIPAYVVLALVGSGMSLFVLAAWLITLIRGTMPRALHGALSAQLRFSLRVASYLYLLQDAYPRGLFGDADETPTVAAVADELAHEATASDEGVDEGVAAASDESDDRESAPWSQDWTLRLTAGARRIVVISLVLGVVTLPASIVVGYEIGHHAGHSAEQTWSTTYGARVATLNGDAKRAVVALSVSPPNWSAIGSACDAINTDIQSLATVPQYPAHAPDQLLLNGFAAVFHGDAGCLGAVTSHRTSGLSSTAAVMQVGSTDLTAFLSAIPAP